MIRRSLYVYSAYFAQFLKARMEYKADFITSLLANILVTLSGLLFIIILIDGRVVPSLRGWNREEVLFIYGYSLLSTALFNMVGPNLYRFSDKYIIEGQFDRVLLRPLNSLCQVLFESFNLESMGNIFVGLSLLWYSASSLGLLVGPLDLVWLLVSSISGGVILLSVFVTLTSLSFHFEDRLGIGAPVYNLITFSRYPLPIFNQIIQFILRWVIPFSFIAFYPATHFLGRTGFEFFCYFTPVMALIFLSIAGFTWGFGVRRYASVGN